MCAATVTYEVLGGVDHTEDLADARHCRPPAGCVAVVSSLRPALPGGPVAKSDRKPPVRGRFTSQIRNDYMPLRF
jgi:hypothetical protein